MNWSLQVDVHVCLSTSIQNKKFDLQNQKRYIFSRSKIYQGHPFDAQLV